MTTNIKRAVMPAILAVLVLAVALLTAAPTVFADVLKGNTFANVAAVQARLATLGYYSSTVDGKWGSRTTAAVKRFQTDNGLKADGIVGSSTESKLRIRLPQNGRERRGGASSAQNLRLL